MHLVDKLFNYTAEEINYISSKTNVMTEYHDIVIGLWIIANHKPKHFFELGTGTGGWPVTMHNVLCMDDTRFTLSEDMTWGLSDFNYRGESYPKTIQELSQLIHAKSKTPMKFEVLQNADLAKIQPYDTIRIDCEPSFEAFEMYINHCDKSSIVFIDDFKFNISLKRVAYTMELVSKNKLFPLWFGDQESAWTTSKEYRDNLLRIMYNQIGKMKLLKVNPRVFDQGRVGITEWRYINTRGSSDLLFTTHKENSNGK